MPNHDKKIRNAIPKPVQLRIPVNAVNIKSFQRLMVTDFNTNILDEAPVSDKVYISNDKKYGRPQFRLLTEYSEEKIPGQQGFRFSKGENNELFLNVVIEAFFPREDVTPLDFRNVKLTYVYQAEGKEPTLPLPVKQILPVEEEINISKHIYAQTKIANENKEAIFEALTDPSKGSRLNISCEVWWQKPRAGQKSSVKNVKSHGASPTKVRDVSNVIRRDQRIKEKGIKNIMEAKLAQAKQVKKTFIPKFKIANIKKTIVRDHRSKVTGSRNVVTRDHRTRAEEENSIGKCKEFDRAALRSKGNNIYNGNSVFLSFRNNTDPQKALKLINFYRMTQHCVIDKNFSYFLSGNRAPSRRARLRNEDCLSFDPLKITVTNVQNRWKIVEGNRYLFDFGTNATNAKNALRAIKQYGFDTTCYVGRPNPGMTYLKSTKPRERHIGKARRGKNSEEQEQKNVSKPEKVDVKSQIPLFFDKKDTHIFQGFFQDLESKEYKWEKGNKVENSEVQHSFYYRFTNDPNTVFFLPQVYRIAVNPDTGEPRISINMVGVEKESGETEYKIHMTFMMQPYFHPKAKKDLMEEIRSLSGQNIKYVENLIFGGFKDASFQVNQRFKSGNTIFSEEFSENIENIDPTSGFTITATHSLESFDVFKNELLSGGMDIGKVYFQLEQETAEGPTVEKSQPINVELNLKKLRNIPLSVDLNVGNQKGNAPAGFILENKTSIPVNIEGVELSLLSKLENFIYEADLELSTDKVTWPLRLEAGDTEGVFINGEDIEELSDEEMVWSELICEPYGVRADLNPEKIMATVIDHATGDPKMWMLHVSSPLFEFWEQLEEEQKGKYKGIMAMLVEVKTDSGENFSVRLDRSNPVEEIRMARSVGQLLKNSTQKNRKYQYRVTNITIPESPPGDWKTSENTSAEHLILNPELPAET